MCDNAASSAAVDSQPRGDGLTDTNSSIEMKTLSLGVLKHDEL
jgi:hypothetical protein